MYHRLLISSAVMVACLAAPLFGDDQETEQPAEGETTVAAPEGTNAAADNDTPNSGSAESIKAEDDPSEYTPIAGDADHKEPGHESDGENHQANGEHKADSGHAADGDGHDSHGDGHEAEAHGGHGGHGDPHDLSHVNAGSKLNSPDEFKSDLAIWTFVVFVCLLAVLGKFAWGPIMEGLEKREQSIASMIDEARISQEKAAEQLKQYEAKIAAAGEESREIVAKARQDAEAAGERIVAEAEAAAEKQRQRAVADIANAKSAALEEIKTEGVGLAVQLAGQILRRELTAQDHSQLIDDALKQLPSRN